MAESQCIRLMEKESREDKPEYQEWLHKNGLNKDWCTKPAAPSEEALKTTHSIQQHFIKR